jgi:DNA polymerase-1
MTRVLLVVDVKNQVYKATATHLGLFHRRTFTGGVFGVMSALFRAIIVAQATHVVFATDAPPYVRKAFFDGYKSTRKKDPDDDLVKKVGATIPLLRSFLDRMSIPHWELQGFEYDDLAAHAVLQYGHRFDRVVAMTNDSDLYQLFDEHPEFAVYKGKGELYTRADFDKEFPGVTKEHWIRMLCLQGTHNEVPGIAGVGPVNARKAAFDRRVWARYVFDHADIIHRNRRLIELPHHEFPQQASFRVRAHDTIDVRDLVLFCGELDIKLQRDWVIAVKQLQQAK